MHSAVLIRATAKGYDAIDPRKREIPGILPVTPRGGKTARADAIAPLAEAGNIWLPQTRWADDLIEEAAAFPNGTHDDQVDALTQAVAWALIPDPAQAGYGTTFYDIG